MLYPYRLCQVVSIIVSHHRYRHTWTTATEYVNAQRLQREAVLTALAPSSPLYRKAVTQSLSRIPLDLVNQVAPSADSRLGILILLRKCLTSIPRIESNRNTPSTAIRHREMQGLGLKRIENQPPGHRPVYPALRTEIEDSVSQHLPGLEFHDDKKPVYSHNS